MQGVHVLVAVLYVNGGVVQLAVARTGVDERSAVLPARVQQGADIVSGEFRRIIRNGTYYIGQAYDGTFNNNVYVDGEVSYNTIFDKQGNPDPYQNEWSFGTGFINRITKFCDESSSVFVIPAGECTGAGYANGGTSGGSEQRPPIESVIEESPVYYTIAFEDLGAVGDFDFNDVVLLISYYATKNRAKVELAAAGGTLPIGVRYDGTTLFTKDSREMINTYSRGDAIATTYLDNFDATISELKQFSIVVQNGGETKFISSGTERGDVPLALIIPGKWQWPLEQTSIVSSYPSFVNWVENLSNINWYTNPDSNYVVQ